MIALPEEFGKRMRERLQGDFPAFLRSYETPPVRGLRVNPLKISREAFLRLSPYPLTPVPWEANGFYLEDGKAGSHVYHSAGLYYMQEPSAMCAVPLLDVKEGERVLDLCAAPGGKTTQIAAALNGKGILIANEYEYSRAKILSSNLERLGVTNAAAVSESAEQLLKIYPEYFDKILVDAPCSGEGMFKKEAAAIPEWSVAQVKGCALRQKAILDAAAGMLAADGKMVYSTCTFSPEEDEEQVENFLKAHPEFTLLKEELLLPHEVRGEGHFAAVLQKVSGGKGSKKPFPAKKNSEAERAFRAFAKDFFVNPPECEMHTLADGRMYAIPVGMPVLPPIIVRAGVELGEWDGRRFKPAHCLAMSLKQGQAREAALSREECEKYLRGEVIPCDLENGWYVATVAGFPLGLQKAVNGVLKNHLPKGLRRQ